MSTPHDERPAAPILPELQGDRSPLYLGVRTFTGRTLVWVHELHGVPPAADEDGDGPGRVVWLPYPDVVPLAYASGFQWGEGTGGAWVLARALLLHACGPLAAQRHWPAFLEEVVRRLPRHDWHISRAQVESWVARRHIAPT